MDGLTVDRLTVDIAPSARAVPFVGLRAFDMADAGWFFGRDREVAALTRKLRGARFTAVVGPSGSGKSSLVRAGVMPLLRQEDWRQIIVRPGSEPMRRLAAGLAASEHDALTEARRFRYGSMLRASAFGLAQIAETLARQAPRLLLVVDQFEEVFRHGAEAAGTGRAAMREEARAFVEALLEASAGSAGRLHICITMRSDFFGSCAAYAGLAEAVSQSQFLVPCPLRGQLEEATRRPVAKAGALIDDALVQRLLVDVHEEADPLPLLQHTLRRLWEGAAGAPRRLDVAHYVEVGRISGSIEKKAEEVLARLGRAHPADAVAAERIFKALTRLDEHERATRRPQTRSELLALLRDTPGLEPGLAEASLARVILAMSTEDTSFLQVGDGDDPEIDIGHEALIRGWKRTAGIDRDFRTGWLREEIEDGDRWRGYVRRARDRSALTFYEDRRLGRWLRRRNLGAAWSRRYGNEWAAVAGFRGRSRRSSLVRGCGLLLLFGCILGAVWWTLDQRAVRSARLGSLSLAAEARAQSALGDARVAALLARAALPASLSPADARFTPQAENALADALARPIEVMRLSGHGRPVYAAAYSPDGRRIASGGQDGMITLWDAATGQPIGAPLRGHTDVVTSVGFSADGRTILSASYDRTLRLWDAASGRPVGGPWLGHRDKVWSAAFSPDGRRVVSGSADDTVRVWDSATGKAIFELGGHTGDVTSVAFSPDGARIVSGSSDQTLRQWDAATGQPIGQPLQGHTEALQSVAFSPDGSRIVSASVDRTLRLWDSATGQAIGGPLAGHTADVESAAYSPDGRLIVSASDDRTLRLWNAATGQPVGPPLQGHGGVVSGAVFSPDGRHILSASTDGTMRVWSTGAGQPAGPPLRGHADVVNAVAFSPDGRRIVSASADRTLRLWDGRSGRPVGAPLRGHTGDVWSVAFSPDGSRIVSGAADRTLRLWDAGSGQPLGPPMRGHGGAVTSVAVSPDGSRIVSGSADRTLRLWDAASLRMVGRPLTGHAGAVLSVAFSPDGRRIASGGADGTLRLWDAGSGQPVGPVLRGHSDAVVAVAFSRDGSRIVSASEDRTLRVWDAASLQPIGAPLRRHTGGVTGVAISPDGRRIVSTSSDRSLRVWDMATGLPVGEPLRGHAQAVMDVAFSPDGRAIVSASEDTTLRLWDMAPFTRGLAELVARADQLCPLDEGERAAQGLFDPVFPTAARPRTPDQARACGDAPAR